MKRKNSKTLLVKALGAAHRDQYLEDHPHGFARVNKVHKSKKKYSRKSKKDSIEN